MVSGDDTVDKTDELRLEVEKLRRENEELKESTDGGSPGHPRRRGRWRRLSAWVLIVLASLLAVVSVLVVFTRNEILDTNTYVATVGPLASDPAVQSAVADRVSQQLIKKVDAQQRVSSALPQKAKFLAAPITSGLEALTRQVTLKFVQSSAFKKLWVQANERAHKQVVALLTGDNSGVLTSDRGKVSLDLGNVEAKVKQALDKKGITVFDKVPTANGTSFVLFQSDQLTKLQGLISALNRLAYLLPILGVVCFAGGILLTENRRKGLVRAAVGLALAMGLLLVGVAVGRNLYLNALGKSVNLRAAANIYDAMSAFPLGTTRVVLLVSVIVALVGMAVGNKRLRSWARSVDKPGWLAESSAHRWIRAHRRLLQWATLAIGFVVVVVWDNPSPRVVIVIVVIDLAVVGLIGIMSGRHAALAGVPAGPGSSGESIPSDRPTPTAGLSTKADTANAEPDPPTDTDTGSGSA
ncbi:MAG TPA: hypothetical protein VG226_03715 [Acidimicrobiales bacterium]|nr:hypothetical protein [Acidimicrobiales bacterium]